MAHSDAFCQLLGKVTAPGDDETSVGSLDAVDRLLANFADDKVSIKDLLGPLPDFDYDGPVPVESWNSMFDDGLPPSPSISATVSHGSSFDQGGETLRNDSIDGLITGRFLGELVPTTMDLTGDDNGHDKNEGSIKQESTNTSLMSTTLRPALPQVQVDDSIHRIMVYLHYTEPDRRLVAYANGVIQNCITKHQKQMLKNPGSNVKLSGKIFEELVRLFGGKFSAIYRNAMVFSAPPQNSFKKIVHGNPRPSMVELALAYGVHITRMYASHGKAFSEAQDAKYVSQGAAYLTSLSENERRELWDFIMTTNDYVHVESISDSEN
jgi:hypothetical protein